MSTAPSTSTPSAKDIAEFTRRLIAEFRANGGKVSGPFAGADLLLLTTVGAKSGQEHTVPLGFLRDGDRLLVIGSAGGSPRHPAWYHNLLAHPVVRVEVGTETFGAVAVPAEGEQREKLFQRVVAEAPGYGDYQARTRRKLPVVVLERSLTEAGRDQVANLADKLVEVHTWLRAQLRHVRAEADAHFAAREAHTGPGTPPGPGLSLQLRQHCLALCDGLQHHHAGEDAVMFPELDRQYPHLRQPLERLRAEHRTVARIQGELQALLADIRTADPQRFRAELARMSAELEAHLDYEEESLIPVLAQIPLPRQPR